MNRAAWMGVAVALVVISGIVLYFRSVQTPTGTETLPPSAEAETQSPAQASGEPEVHYPVSEPEATAAPLPTLADSDDELRSGLAAVFGEAQIARFLVPRKIVQSLVVTINSLDDEPVPLRQRPVPATDGRLVVEGEGESLTLAAENAQRYRPFVAALQAADAERLAGFYLRYYPLFQRAYQDLGYPNRHFNDRLIRIIDHLLATPEVTAPLQLVRVKGLYQFADAEIEALSSGQKTLIRIGPDNAAVVKAKLREIRAAITARSGRA